MTSSRLREPEVMDYAVVMGTIYSMVKQDYKMQVLLEMRYLSFCFLFCSSLEQ